MKKFFTVTLPIFIMIIMAFFGIGIYMIFTNKLPEMKTTQNVIEQSIISEDDNSIILSEEELPRLDASVAMQPLMTAIVRDFTQDKNFSESTLNYTNTEDGYEKLINGDIDILLATAPTEDILLRANAKNVEFEMVPVTREAFVFYVNSSNPIDSLNLEDIQKIYSGQVNNWSQLGGNNIAISAFQRTENSLSQIEMKKSVMNGLEMIEPSKDIFYDKTYGEISDLIMSFDNSENAIGYSYYSEAKILYDTDAKIDSTIKFLNVNEIEPNYENIHNGTYPIQTNYYLIKNKNNNSEIVQIFMDAIFSDRGKKIVKEAGYIDN